MSIEDVWAEIGRREVALFVLKRHTLKLQADLEALKPKPAEKGEYAEKPES